MLYKIYLIIFKECGIKIIHNNMIKNNLCYNSIKYNMSVGVLIRVPTYLICCMYCRCLIKILFNVNVFKLIMN